MKKNHSAGFTMIELLITLVVISIIVTISTFAMQNARKSGRDGKRKSDLEAIRSGLEIYRSDCATYPAPSGSQVANPLKGSGSSSTCLSSNVYLSETPQDPDSAQIYLYARPSSQSYELCASLEDSSLSTVSCGGSSNCGGGSQCNYKVTSP